MSAPEVVVRPDADDLAATVARELVARLAAAQAEHGTASVVLTGGGIGTAVLRAVAAVSGELDWTQVDVWWGDERWVPAADDDRNEKGAREALLDVVGVPAERVHAIPAADAGFAEPEDAAAAYAQELAAAGDGAVPRIDVLLLGVGPEGHVASIFPDSPAVADERTVVAVRDCPKPPPTRVSLGFPVITAAEEVWLLVSGEGKAEAVARALSGRETPASLPAAGAVGRRATRWMLDQDAAAQL
ncbi:6-phosphogluconolactonase [Klenkia sp. PcliD-1-E]|uniref:6-phosphogluconolactonase n=1 Tax=Klenkia sp. PcliD-1-E TaxID=2954492 RepID=UPI002096C498|nr:6-phosphogluconolactonase [Klenkia sp. PcliD-1-E]MCO7219218.1 6-phosphogluconolactonase [Klenkia sp. PcliD-1-E]